MKDYLISKKLFDELFKVLGISNPYGATVLTLQNTRFKFIKEEIEEKNKIKIKTDKELIDLINTIGYGAIANLFLNNLIELNIEETDMPTNPIMTRAEAIALFKEHLPSDYNKAERVIDFFITTGILEIKEEEETSFIQVVHKKLISEKGVNISITTVGLLLAVISSMGYEIKAK